MKGNKKTSIVYRPSCVLIGLALLTGCTGGYKEFADKATVTAVLGFCLGTSLLYTSNRIIDAEKVRMSLKKFSYAGKRASYLLAAISIVLMIFGLLHETDELAYNYAFSGAILLFVSNRFYCSSENWRLEEWDAAKLNSKMMTFAISIIGVIIFLIHGETLLGF